MRLRPWSIALVVGAVALAAACNPRYRAFASYTPQTNVVVGRTRAPGHFSTRHRGRSSARLESDPKFSGGKTKHAAR